MELVQANKQKQYSQMKKLYMEAFPANERKPFWLIRKKQKSGETNMWCIMEGTEFVGLAITMEVGDLVVLDYFAICKEQRGNGYGTRALTCLKEKYEGKRLLLEIEDVDSEGPDLEMRVRRKAFYLGNGLQELNVKVTLYGVDMELLGVNCAVTFDEYKRVYTTLYGRAPEKFVVHRETLIIEMEDSQKKIAEKCEERRRLVSNQMNYQKELDKVIATLGDSRPTLLLHSCCAPCSSYVLEYLRAFFTITVFYYNPNISFMEEYRKRVEEQKRLIATFNKEALAKDFAPIQIIEGDYEPQLFYEMAKGREDLPEGGERCFDCYRLRLEATARLAKQEGFDYFGTTLTISPLKNAAKLNEIGFELEQEMRGLVDEAHARQEDKSGQLTTQAPRWLPSDFKKKNGYKRSIELSAQYDLYRQDYCGCVYSKRDREKQKAE